MGTRCATPPLCVPHARSRAEGPRLAAGKNFVYTAHSWGASLPADSEPFFKPTPYPGAGSRGPPLGNSSLNCCAEHPIKGCVLYFQRLLWTIVSFFKGKTREKGEDHKSTRVRLDPRSSATKRPGKLDRAVFCTRLTPFQLMLSALRCSAEAQPAGRLQKGGPGPHT